MTLTLVARDKHPRLLRATEPTPPSTTKRARRCDGMSQGFVDGCECPNWAAQLARLAREPGPTLTDIVLQLYVGSSITNVWREYGDPIRTCRLVLAALSPVLHRHLCGPFCETRECKAGHMAQRFETEEEARAFRRLLALTIGTSAPTDIGPVAELETLLRIADRFDALDYVRDAALERVSGAPSFALAAVAASALLREPHLLDADRRRAVASAIIVRVVTPAASVVAEVGTGTGTGTGTGFGFGFGLCRRDAGTAERLVALPLFVCVLEHALSLSLSDVFASPEDAFQFARHWTATYGRTAEPIDPDVASAATVAFRPRLAAMHPYFISSVVLRATRTDGWLAPLHDAAAAALAEMPRAENASERRKLTDRRLVLHLARVEATAGSAARADKQISESIVVFHGVYIAVTLSFDRSGSFRVDATLDRRRTGADDDASLPPLSMTVAAARAGGLLPTASSCARLESVASRSDAWSAVVTPDDDDVSSGYTVLLEVTGAARVQRQGR